METKDFFAQCPKQQCNELDNETFDEIAYFYNSIYKSSFMARKIFDVVCSVDKTLLTFIAGSLTSFSINLATNFINLEKMYFSAEFVFRIFQFVFAVGFNVYTICFAAKVINVQECGERYYPSQRISKILIGKAQQNVMFYACMNSYNYLKNIILRGGICIIVIIISIIFRFSCVEGINQIILLLRNLLEVYKNIRGL